MKGLRKTSATIFSGMTILAFFAALRGLQDQIKAEKIPNIAMDELSMGMTGDFEAAIEEGATMVRIGTAIFGERS